MLQQIISSMEGEKTVLNLLTGRWINPYGKLFQKLIREGFIYTDSLSDYIEDIWGRSKFFFSHPVLILPLSILANRSDIREKFLISVESAIKSRISLFTQEKNKQSSLQNLIQMNYFSENLTILLKFSWEDKETKAWRDIVLMKFLNQPNLVLSKYKLNALYDAFIETDVLEPEHINLTLTLYSTHHIMSAIMTKFVTDHKLTNEISFKELSQYAPEILELLTDDKEKRCQAPPVPERSGLEAEKVNICQVSDSTCTKETIKEMAQSSSKIQKERSEKHKNEGIDFLDHFSLKSVKERLDLYDVSNTPDKQALADIMIMLYILRVFRSLEKNEEQAKELLTWIQEAIVSRQLRDPGKLGSIYLSTFLKKDEFIPKPYKPLLTSSLRKIGSVFAFVVHSAKNLSEANTFASEALRHSPENHASPSDRYTIHDSSSSTWIFGLDEQNAKVYSVLSREIRALDKKLDNYYSEYNSLKKSVKRLERSVEFLATELENLDECVDRKTVVNLIHEIALSPNIKKYKNSSYSSESSKESDLVETVVVKK
ncbi:28886_t:CDS:2 [Gigaspora margarita]|uniref:28886_t:CDS:1 n=1 Tax=Gigaspora margarita TaxID=4874 RepID=A0ABN7W7B5_GIGMA|nr:28886_t:CDS:2 [Gigaspora margarita]